jgi:hypothetical protein
MADTPLDPDKLDDTEAERRFNETLGRMLSTPPKPHHPKPEKPPLREDHDKEA